MLLEEIKNGETLNIEFKKELSNDHKKYLKTVVAFANGSGGKIIFGVEDNSLNVIGVNNDDAFKIKDAITNAIFASCEPAIIPNVYLETLKNKTIIVVEVYPGWQKPYHIKSLGIENGTFIRVAGTTRQAEMAMVKELMFEGSNRFFDKTICPEISVNESDISKLCNSLRDVALENCRSAIEKDNVELLSKNQLISWGVLIEKDGVIYPTNAYAMLVGSPVVPNTVQCALFKGTDRTEVLDMKEYSGPVYEQINYAYQFILRNIKMSASFDGLARNNKYELPIYAIRELVVNAFAHRSYIDRNSVKVALYDDRLEVTSPGKLPLGQTISKMKNGNSTIRNEALAHILQYLNYIEAWGRGIPRIIKSVVDVGLKEPSFLGGETELTVNIYRSQDHQPIQNNDIEFYGQSLNETKEDLILNIIKANPYITGNEIANRLGLSISQVKYYTGKMVDEKLITRVGSNRKGYWIINSNRI